MVSKNNYGYIPDVVKQAAEENVKTSSTEKASIDGNILTTRDGKKIILNEQDQYFLNQYYHSYSTINADEQKVIDDFMANLMCILKENGEVTADELISLGSNNIWNAIDGANNISAAYNLSKDKIPVQQLQQLDQGIKESQFNMIELLVLEGVIPSGGGKAEPKLLESIAHRYGDNVAKSVGKMVSKYGDDVAKLVTNYGDDVGRIVTKYGDDIGKIVDKYGYNMGKFIVQHGDNVVEYINTYGDDAAQLISRYGDDASAVINKGISPTRVKELESAGVEVQDYGKNNIVDNKSAAEYIKGANKSIKQQMLETQSAKLWGTLPDGTNQGVKHFADYWEKYPERIPSLEERLGANVGEFENTVKG